MFALVRVAWAAVVECCYPAFDDTMEELIDSLSTTAVMQEAVLTGALATQHAEMLIDYVQRLLASFSEMVTAFRKGGTVQPSVGAVVAMHNEDWSLLTQMSSVWKNFPKHQHQQGGGDKGEDKDGEKPTKSKLKREREKAKGKAKKEARAETAATAAKTQKPAAAAAAAAESKWSSKPQFEKEVWAGICENFKEQFPEHCSWYALTKQVQAGPRRTPGQARAS
jgi:hypothetical protein